MTTRRHLLGYPVDSLSLHDAVARIGEFVTQPVFHHVAAINANKLWLAERNPELKGIMQRAELVIPEYAVIWGCWIVGRPLKGHVGGIMLLKALLPWLSRAHVPTYFLGARQYALDQMRIRIEAAYPDLPIAGTHSGYFGREQEAEIVQNINNSGAKLLFVAMGSPRQEFWIERHRDDLDVSVALGVGGSFDVVAGIKKDAPSWIRHGGEWLYRLGQDPKNLWKRYLTTNPWFICRVLQERLKGGEH